MKLRGVIEFKREAPRYTRILIDGTRAMSELFSGFFSYVDLENLSV